MKLPLAIFLTILLLLPGLWCQAQSSGKPDGSASPVIYHDISGSPFFHTEWSDGVILFSSGRKATQFKIKFDCLKNQVMLEFNGSSFYAQSRVSEFALYPGKGHPVDTQFFKKGFPPTIKTSEETFFWVMVEGRTSLLCLPAKNIVEEPQLVSKVVFRRITQNYEYYLLTGGQLMLLPEDQRELPALFPAHQDELKEYITSNKLNFRDPQELARLVRHYNTLAAESPQP